ncbi:MAG TPA: hypothetical protein VFL83_21130 [Anaeromyxobacter sp.]|nr:hypothetical protein [Anaeromyxobacter sp.]
MSCRIELPRALGAALAAILAAAPGAASPDEVSPGPEDAVVAAAPADRAEVERLRRELRSRAAQVESGRGRLLFAETGGPYGKEPGPIVPVADPDSWPDDAATSWIVVLDERRRVRLLQESPVSWSGDWSLDLTHVFDAEGRTVAFQRFSGFFNSGCSEVARERSVAYFDGRGRRLAREWRLENGKRRLLSPKGCQFPYRNEYAIHRDARSAVDAARLGQALAAAGAVVPRAGP